ncbi:MAG: hypothetical protein D6814_13825 [Calditrichaeota bacterium]|nr:MAG: hypothetical protein D6814_13825 [Calditrichota bacterium]
MLKQLFSFAIALAVLSIFMITCGSRDDRDRIRSDFGEPDRIVTQGIDPFWRETWFYDSTGVGFEFRRTSGCGSLRDVFLFQQFSFNPAPKDSTKSLQMPLQGDNPLGPKD